MVFPVVLSDLVVAEEARVSHLDAMDPQVMHHGVVRNFEQAVRALNALKFTFCRNSVMIRNNIGVLRKHPREVDGLLFTVRPEELLDGMSFLIVNPRMRRISKNSVAIIALPLLGISVMRK